MMPTMPASSRVSCCHWRWRCCWFSIGVINSAYVEADADIAQNLLAADLRDQDQIFGDFFAALRHQSAVLLVDPDSLDQWRLGIGLRQPLQLLLVVLLQRDHHRQRQLLFEQ